MAKNKITQAKEREELFAAIRFPFLALFFSYFFDHSEYAVDGKTLTAFRSSRTLGNRVTRQEEVKKAFLEEKFGLPQTNPNARLFDEVKQSTDYERMEEKDEEPIIKVPYVVCGYFEGVW